MPAPSVHYDTVGMNSMSQCSFCAVSSNADTCNITISLCMRHIKVGRANSSFNGMTTCPIWIDRQKVTWKHQHTLLHFSAERCSTLPVYLPDLSCKAVRTTFSQ